MSLSSNVANKKVVVRRNLLLDLPIAGRLALGFIIAALVAGVAVGAVTLQRAQSLSRQTDFYHHLLQVNTSLTTGHSFLESMNSKLHQTLDDASAPVPSRETLTADNAALTNLASLYTETLNQYVQDDLLNQHSDQLALLNEAGQGDLSSQQITLVGSTQRTWQYYQAAQQSILALITGPDMTPADLANAQTLLHQQGEPTSADALSALHSLIQLNDRLASAADDATSLEVQNELITTAIATLCAFVLIALVGWFISESLVRRLRDLQRVSRAVEAGKMDERVPVAGRDEIAEVSLAVNSMMDTITSLLNETRNQRDALTGAAEHLFTDMRVVNAGDLRISATVSNDPIGMLANAFNFTVGRFRRFILRTQTTIEQLDVVSRLSSERSLNFIGYVRTTMRDMNAAPQQPASHAPGSGPLAHTSPLAHSGPLAGSGPLNRGPRKIGPASNEPNPGALLQLARADMETRFNTARETAERATLSLSRLNDLITPRTSSLFTSAPHSERQTQAQAQELAVLEQLLRKLSREVRQVQSGADASLGKLERAVNDLSDLADRHETTSTTSIPTMHDAQYQEFVRQAGSFAVEINDLGRRLGVILQEMRTGITPFRLDQAAEASRLDQPEPAHQHPISMGSW